MDGFIDQSRAPDLFEKQAMPRRMRLLSTHASPEGSTAFLLVEGFFPFDMSGMVRDGEARGDRGLSHTARQLDLVNRKGATC